MPGMEPSTNTLESAQATGGKPVSGLDRFFGPLFFIVKIQPLPERAGV